MLEDGTWLLTLGINAVDKDEIEVFRVLVLHLLKVLPNKIGHGVDFVVTSIFI